MQAKTRIVVSALAALALYAGSMVAVAKSVRAHGDAHWIQEGPYRDAEGVHCCGPSDCRRDMAAKFRESPEGVWVTTGAGVELLMPRASWSGTACFPRSTAIGGSAFAAAT